ncbi:phenylalanine--tRNA ligase subunit alpha [Candidatus Pacearchaeota archaeon]|nr:phenylalanine--tRNA ligase subunit alpha [Candidatus Pacearchaeota archaeon]
MDTQKIIESLSPNEVKILPYLNEEVKQISVKSNLDITSVLRALEFLEKKNIVKIFHEKKKIIELGVNGIHYKKNGLPERKLLNFLREKRVVLFEEAVKQSGLSDDEFKAALGVLKRKQMIELKNGRIFLSVNNELVSKKFPEENFLDFVPVDYESLSKEQKEIFSALQSRKGIVQIKDEKETTVEVSPFGKEIANSKIKTSNLIEQITPEMLKKDSLWKGKKFRRYDVTSKVPEIHGGKRHFVNQATDYARKIWTEMGFKEMSGNLVVSSFWNFDALFSAQDHPVREMQDTFFIDAESELPDKKIVKAVKEAHEGGVAGSKGWGYEWSENEAKKTVLRTHTTCLSAQTLARIKKDEMPAKFFAVGKVFRNETVDWKHGFEFNQTEGIVVDKNANFRHLLGYLKEFAKKMGYGKVRFRPGYFPFTEPSVEGDVWDEGRKEWVEMIAAGIFRPEVTTPLLGGPVPVLAWGPGFDRMLMKKYGIVDIRELYKNNITQLRKMKYWVKD